MKEKFNLTWHTFSVHGQELFKNLLETQELTDVTLISDDQHQYKVHKFILSACSTVFRTILRSNPLNSSIYLRGIHHEELESILQFIYLGEASFYHERMNEFLNVAKNLDIKEIGKTVFNEDEDNEVEDQNQSFEQEDPVESDYSESNDEAILSRTTSENQNKYSSYSRTLDDQKPEVKKYPCQQCEYQANQLGHLKHHIKVKHDGFKYQCQQCDYQTSWTKNLRQHIKVKHEGIKYQCQQCDFQAKYPTGLQYHVKSKH